MSGVRRQLIRGLEKGYVEVVEELRQSTGQVPAQDTVKRSSLVRGRVVCQFDELRVDTLQNRILRAAIRRLHLVPDIAAGLGAQLRRLEARLEGVTRVPLSPVLFRTLQVTRSHGQDGLLMDVCRLIMDLSLPDEHGTGYRFYDVLQDETRMSTIFEHFVANFYRIEQDEYFVGRDIIRWPVVCAVPSSVRLPTRDDHRCDAAVGNAYDRYRCKVLPNNFRSQPLRGPSKGAARPPISASELSRVRHPRPERSGERGRPTISLNKRR